MPSHPPGKEKASLAGIDFTDFKKLFSKPPKGEWPDLIQRAIACPTPRHEQEDSQPSTASSSTPAKTAKRLYRAASQGQLGKAWRELRASPCFRRPGSVLVGPADDIATVLQELPRALQHTGLCLQPQRTQLWAPQAEQITRHPVLQQMLAKNDGRPRSHHIGGSLGGRPTDPYPIGNETFMQAHLRDVGAAVANDLRKRAVLPRQSQKRHSCAPGILVTHLQNAATLRGSLVEGPPG